jgi:hypothetical protein
MMMFSGDVAGLRNPRAHKILKDDPEMALEFIAFISPPGEVCRQSKEVILSLERDQRAAIAQRTPRCFSRRARPKFPLDGCRQQYSFLANARWNR